MKARSLISGRHSAQSVLGQTKPAVAIVVAPK
jgi:hypothetical protein